MRFLSINIKLNNLKYLLEFYALTVHICGVFFHKISFILASVSALSHNEAKN